MAWVVRSLELATAELWMVSAEAVFAAAKACCEGMAAAEEAVELRADPKPDPALLLLASADCRTEAAAAADRGSEGIMAGLSLRGE